MRLVTAGVATESNTVAPMPTGIDDYTIFRGEPPEDRPTSFTQPFLVWRRLAAERGFTVVGIGRASNPGVHGRARCVRAFIWPTLRASTPCSRRRGRA